MAAESALQPLVSEWHRELTKPLFSIRKIGNSLERRSPSSRQFKLADMATEIDAARLLMHRAAWMKDQGMPTTLQSSMAKLYAGEVAVRVANECVQIHGGYGFIK